MDLMIPYGDDSLNLSIPDERLLAILNLKQTECSGDLDIPHILEKPTNSPPFSQFINNSNRIMIVVNDGTRPTPTAQILDSILPLLLEKLDQGNLKFIIATGTHRIPSDHEYEFIFGNNLAKVRDHIHVHDSRDDPMTEYGTTSRGTPVQFNSMLEEFDSIITIGSVEPHYFAGYTGGRKSLLPGVASYETIEKNHTFSLSPETSSLKLEGNPVHEDMEEAVGIFLDKWNSEMENGEARVFSIQAILSTDHGISKLTCGHIIDSFHEAAEFAMEVYTTSLPLKADIVITATKPPMDLDLYQSQKALENGLMALNEGGIMILVSHCTMGTGNDTFLKLMEKGGEPGKVMEIVNCGYKNGYHKAFRLSALSMYADVWALTTLDDPVLETAFMKPIHDLQLALDLALELKPNGKVVVIPDGSITIPLVK